MDKFKTFIEDVKASGGSEMANCQPFVLRLCENLGIEGPDFAKEENAFNDYVFERRIDFKHGDGSTSAGRIDCYKRGSFILEAKQSAKRIKKKPNPDQGDLLPEEAHQIKTGHAKRGTRHWDKVMRAARKQATDYARALPVEHGYPPFLLIVDVGNVIEIYADFSGQGKNYAHFPDRQSYRLQMDDLLDEEIQQRLIAIWNDPHSLDPAKISAEVTRDIAERLAKIAKRLEGKHDARDVAEFLMRCLFTMFAEDVELIPKQAFETLLGTLKDTPDTFVPALEHLWKTMDEGGFEPRTAVSLKRFNGSLFKNRTALPLDADGIHELWVAAKRDWRDVEPAIFGTLLERALDPRERSKLGAHYTPRAYVERLVIPTIIEPLREDWDIVQADVKEHLEKHDDEKAITAVKKFHHTLCTTRVLDPACGTGNFLYVSLELLKRLEGEVLEALDALGEDAPKFAMQGETVGPNQFYGLEINPRAVPIADLVLWIGFLKWQLRTNGLDSITEPVLDAYGTIKEQDAILAFDKQELLRDDTGKPLSRWDGITKKLHPITGEEIPDPDAQVELYTYSNPRKAEWPEVEFIVGNPPFVGRRRIRENHRDGYLEALSKAYPTFPDNADFVMYWWELAAQILKTNSLLKRFGFITTNSIKQAFNRAVTEPFLNDPKNPLTILFAIPDHPWIDEKDGASVRISITVVQAGEASGKLSKVVSEIPSKEEYASSKLELDVLSGYISPRLRIGVKLSNAKSSIANEGIASVGYQFTGKGFLLDQSETDTITNRNGSSSNFIHNWTNGLGIQRKIGPKFAIDVCTLTETRLQRELPEIYQHLKETVWPERSQNARKSVRERWWVYGEARNTFRPALIKIERLIITSLTASQRLFVFRESSIRADSTTVIIAMENCNSLAVLSSRTHIHWALSFGARLGVGNDPRYTKSETFDPFPFPACITDDTNPELITRLADLGERLDAFRKERLAEHDFLTMTGMYNVLERLRELDNNCDVEPLTDTERDIHEAGLISVLKDIHDEINRATFEAYGWDDLSSALVGRPGATMPSPHKSKQQEEAEEELLTRLVALNLERQAEESKGHVRWLRPDYQIPKLGHKVPQADLGKTLDMDVSVVTSAHKPAWPKDGLDQIRIVRDVLSKSSTLALPGDISASFAGKNSAKRKSRVEDVLQTLVETGAARTGELEGKTRYFIPK